MYERTTDGITTRYYYDGQDIIAEGTVKADKTVEVKAKYLRGADGLIARISDDTAGKVAYYHKNGHGDVIALRDRNGNLLNSYSYDIWGNPLADKTTETVSNPFRYSGEYWDNSTSLQYLRARWYDPSMGRFISEDTYEGELNNPLSLNQYTYVLNNPLKYIDPSGNKAEANGGGTSPQSTVKWKSVGDLTPQEMGALLDNPNLSENDKAQILASMFFSIFAPDGGGSFVAKDASKYVKSFIDLFSKGKGKLNVSFDLKTPDSLRDKGTGSLSRQRTHDRFFLVFFNSLN
jgi:RHS repeat-associated protein